MAKCIYLHDCDYRQHFLLLEMKKISFIGNITKSKKRKVNETREIYDININYIKIVFILKLIFLLILLRFYIYLSLFYRNEILIYYLHSY